MHSVIAKDATARARACMTDKVSAGFSWEVAGRAIAGGGDSINIGNKAAVRPVDERTGGGTALIWLGKDGQREEYSYADLAAGSARFANVLKAQGLDPGDRVFAIMGRTVPLYAAAIGTLKGGVVFTPLFSAFGPVRARTDAGRPVLVHRRSRLGHRHDIRDHLALCEPGSDDR